MAPKQTPIRLPAELRARLDAEATRLDLSLNAVIIMYLDRIVPPLGGERPAPAPPPAPPAPAPADDDVADFD